MGDAPQLSWGPRRAAATERIPRISPRRLIALGCLLVLTALVLGLVRSVSALSVLRAHRLTLKTGETSVYVLPAHRIQVIYLRSNEVVADTAVTQCTISHGGTGFRPALEKAGKGPFAADRGVALVRLARFKTGEAGHYTITCNVNPPPTSSTMLLAPDPRPAMDDLRFGGLLAGPIGLTGLAIIVITRLRERGSGRRPEVDSPQLSWNTADPWT